MIHRGPDNYRENGMGKVSANGAGEDIGGEMKNHEKVAPEVVCSTVSLVTQQSVIEGPSKVRWRCFGQKYRDLHSSVEPCDHVDMKVS